MRQYRDAMKKQMATIPLYILHKYTKIVLSYHTQYTSQHNADVLWILSVCHGFPKTNLGWTMACFVHYTARTSQFFCGTPHTQSLCIRIRAEDGQPGTVFFLCWKLARHVTIYIAVYFVSLFRQKSLDNKFNLQHMGNTLKWMLPLVYTVSLH